MAAAAVADEFHAQWTLPQNTGFSELSCKYCKQVGAECFDQHSGDAFCHEDCARALKGIKACAQEFEGKSSVLCGYHTETGAGKFCASCMEQPAQICANIGGYDFGLCSEGCAHDLNQRYQNEVVKQVGVGMDDVVPRWLRKKVFHKSYRVKDIVECAVMLWQRAQCLDENAGSKTAAQSFDAPMAEVFSILASKKHFEQQSYNAFARFSQFTTMHKSELLDSTQPKDNEARLEEKLQGKCEQAQKKSETNPTAIWNPRFVAKVLARMYKLYFYHEARLAKLKQAGDAELNQVMNNNRRNQEQLVKDEGMVLDEGQHTLAHDLYLALSVLKEKLGLKRGTELLFDGLLIEVTQARPFASSGIPVPPEQAAKIIQSAIGADQQKQIGPNIFQRFLQRGKDAVKGGVYGKGYSVSSVIAVFYELWLMNVCGVQEARDALNYQKKIAEAIELMRSRYGNASTPDAKKSMVYYRDYWNQFADNAASQIDLTLRIQESRDKVRTPGNADKACHKSRPRNADTTIVARLEKEIRSMYTYYWGLTTGGVLKPSQKPPSGKTLTPGQKEFNADIAMILKELAKKVGSDMAATYLKEVFSNNKDTDSAPMAATPNPAVDQVTGTPVAVAAAPAASRPSAPPRAAAAAPAAATGPKKAQALYAYTASRDDEVSLADGDVVTINDNSEDWWKVTKADGKTGLAPGNFLKAL